MSPAHERAAEGTQYKHILQDRKLDPIIPAFSVLGKHQTFLDDALVGVPGARTQELETYWHKTMQDLLDLAIVHELAHGACDEMDEVKTEKVAEQILAGKAVTCPARSATTFSRPRPPNP